jgi:hypothetical protein
MADEAVTVARVSMPGPPEIPVNGDGKVTNHKEHMTAVNGDDNKSIEEISPMQPPATNGSAVPQPAPINDTASHNEVQSIKEKSEEKQTPTKSEKKSNGASTSAAPVSSSKQRRTQQPRVNSDDFESYLSIINDAHRAARGEIEPMGLHDRDQALKASKAISSMAHMLSASYCVCSQSPDFVFC